MSMKNRFNPGCNCCDDTPTNCCIDPPYSHVTQPKKSATPESLWYIFDQGGIQWPLIETALLYLRDRWSREDVSIYYAPQFMTLAIGRPGGTIGTAYVNNSDMYYTSVYSQSWDDFTFPLGSALKTGILILKKPRTVRVKFIVLPFDYDPLSPEDILAPLNGQEGAVFECNSSGTWRQAEANGTLYVNGASNPNALDVPWEQITLAALDVDAPATPFFGGPWGPEACSYFPYSAVCHPPANYPRTPFIDKVQNAWPQDVKYVALSRFEGFIGFAHNGVGNPLTSGYAGPDWGHPNTYAGELYKTQWCTWETRNYWLYNKFPAWDEYETTYRLTSFSCATIPPNAYYPVGTYAYDYRLSISGRQEAGFIPHVLVSFGIRFLDLVTPPPVPTNPICRLKETADLFPRGHRFYWTNGIPAQDEGPYYYIGRVGADDGTTSKSKYYTVDEDSLGLTFGEFPTYSVIGTPIVLDE